MIKRARGIHVETEPEWHLDYEFEMRLTELVPFIIQWCKTDVRIFLTKALVR